MFLSFSKLAEQTEVNTWMMWVILGAAVALGLLVLAVETFGSKPDLRTVTVLKAWIENHQERSRHFIVLEDSNHQRTTHLVSISTYGQVMVGETVVAQFDAATGELLSIQRAGAALPSLGDQAKK